ncbi:MAG: hypothetical protein ACRCZS_06660 [Chroococcidiopsis sp.]
MDLPNSPTNSLVTGKLVLTNGDSKVSFLTTSGLSKHQYIGSWTQKARGCLPPSAKGIDYSISTQRLWMPDVKGVEGSFYAIAPFSVTVDGVTRGDFGLHYDPVPGTPGSAGCIVLRMQEHWDIIRAKMKEFADMRIKSVPLEVIYS